MSGAADSLVWTFDFDGTISAAPEQLSRIAKGLKDQGDKIVVLTGNPMPHKNLLKILDEYGFPYDEVIQYQDDESNGIVRAHYLKQFKTWGAFDNRIDRAVIFAPICPHLYLVVEATKEDKQNAKGHKKEAKQTAKKAGLRSRLEIDRFHTELTNDGSAVEGSESVGGD